MKRLLTALSLPMVSLVLLSACTIGQPAASTPAPEPSETPSVTDSASPTTESPMASGTPDAGSPSATPTESGYSSDPSATASDASTDPSGSLSPSATASGSAGDFRAPGEVLDLNGEVTITALDSKRAKVAGHRNSQVLVMAKTCNTNAQAGIELTWDTWVLLGPDSEEYPASTVKGTNEPAPVYPNGNGRLYKPGQCAKGWIVFDVPTGSQLSGVRYMNSTGDSAQWRLSGNI